MKAINVYNSVAAPQSARQEEATAFRLAARKLREATDRTARNKALRVNHELWSIMLRDLGGSGNGLPAILKKDCLFLALFSTDYSTRAVLDIALSLDPLIETNEQVADGLDGRRPITTPAPTERAPIFATV